MIKATAIKAEKIRDDLFVLRPNHYMWPNSANVYVITDSKGFSMIDLGCGGATCLQRIEEGLSQLDLSIKNLHTVVLSHAHPDHIGAGGWLLKEFSPKILIHSHDYEQAKDPNRLIKTFDIELAKKIYGDGLEFDFELITFFDNFGCSMSSVMADERLEEGDFISLGRYEFEVIHTPGHSPGHISLFDKKTGILYSGDLVGKVVAWYTPSSGGVIGYLKSLDKMEKRIPSLLLPSHGEKIKNPTEKINYIRKRLLNREEKVITILSEGAHTFLNLNDKMYSKEQIRFYPGVGITESHIRKLAIDGKIRRNGDMIYLV